MAQPAAARAAAEAPLRRVKVTALLEEPTAAKEAEALVGDRVEETEGLVGGLGLDGVGHAPEDPIGDGAGFGSEQSDDLATEFAGLAKCVDGEKGGEDAVA